MAALAPLLTAGEVDPRHVMFITDDVAPDFLLEHGHLDNAVRVAIAHGVDPVLAVQAATVAPAEYLGLRHDIGSIAPGRFADILFVADLSDFRPQRVLVDGTDIGAAESGGGGHAPRPDRAGTRAAARLSVRVPADLSEADLRIPALRPARPGPGDRHGRPGGAHRAPDRRGAACATARSPPTRPRDWPRSRWSTGTAAVSGTHGKQVALGFVSGLGPERRSGRAVHRQGHPSPADGRHERRRHDQPPPGRSPAMAAVSPWSAAARSWPGSRCRSPGCCPRAP